MLLRQTGPMQGPIFVGFGARVAGGVNQVIGSRVAMGISIGVVAYHMLRPFA